MVVSPKLIAEEAKEEAEKGIFYFRAPPAVEADGFGSDALVAAVLQFISFAMGCLEVDVAVDRAKQRDQQYNLTRCLLHKSRKVAD